MRLTRFNTFFPLLFILSEFVIIYLVTKLMHYLTFAEWTFYNTLIIAFLKKRNKFKLNIL